MHLSTLYSISWIVSLNCWVLSENPRYIFAVSHSLILIYGGFGHRPPHVRSWCSFGVIGFYLQISCSYGKLTQSWLLLFLGFASWVWSTIPVCESLSQNLLFLPHTCPPPWTSFSELWGAETPVSNTGDSGLSRISALSNGDSGTPETDRKSVV